MAADRRRSEYFGTSGAARDPKGARRILPVAPDGCVVFTVDERLTGRPQVSKIPCLSSRGEFGYRHALSASIPTRGPEAVREAKRLVAAGGVRGLKLHPPLQQFFPERSARLSAVRSVCRGQTAGLVSYRAQRHRHRHAGRRRHPAEVRQPDADRRCGGGFPGVPIILAHPSFPWQDEAISVCLHKPTVYIDLSGWSPKYFSPTLIQYANTLLKTRCCSGPTTR